MTTHSQFKNLRQRWLKRTALNELDCLTTRQFQPANFLKVLELASVDNTSISDACLYYRTQGYRVPASETVLKALRTVPGEYMEIYVNQILRQQFHALPAKYRRNLKKLGIVIIDFHDDPYYGTLTNPDIVRKGTKRSTQHFYSYLTADLYTPQGKQTIALRRQLPGERVADLFWDLFASLEAILTPKLILMDGEFAIYRILQPLTQMGIQFIVRKPLTKGLKPLALAYELTDDWGSVRKFHRIIIQDKHYKSQKMPVYITFQRVQGHAKILLVSSAFLQKPDVITNLYRIRFAIETGYRDKHQFQARTTSSHLSIRLMLFLFAILLWNLWQAFLLQVNSSTSYLLPRTNKWRRQLKTIKRFLLRDALL